MNGQQIQYNGENGDRGKDETSIKSDSCAARTDPTTYRDIFPSARLPTTRAVQQQYMNKAVTQKRALPPTAQEFFLGTEPTPGAEFKVGVGVKSGQHLIVLTRSILKSDKRHERFTGPLPSRRGRIVVDLKQSAYAAPYIIFNQVDGS